MQNVQARGGAPYGLSFAIEELHEARRWAELHRLTMTVALDRVIDGAEFEEMLLVVTRDRRRRVLTLWRTEAGVVAQPVGCLPSGYGCLTDALRAVAGLAPRRRFWGR